MSNLPQYVKNDMFDASDAQCAAWLGISRSLRDMGLVQGDLYVLPDVQVLDYYWEYPVVTKYYRAKGIWFRHAGDRSQHVRDAVKVARLAAAADRGSF